MGLREMESRLPPGFRFYPSDEELVCFYLRKKVANERVSSGMTLIEVDLHAREPWELPVVAKLTADEWYFFSFRDKKYATGSRRNRATKMGYWKATGNDRTVHETGMATYGGLVGMRKTLVFYRGRAPNGYKTDWVMHEFRLEAPNSPPKEDWVLCRVFNKAKASQTEQGSKIKTNHTITGGTGIGPSSPTAVSLGSSPDPSAVDKFDGRHQPIAAEAAMGSSNSSSDTPVPLMHGDHHTGGSSCATLDLAMLQYYSLLEEYCADPAMHDGTVAVGANYTSCSAGSDRYINDGMVERELGLGRVGFRDHGMGDIEMKMEVQAGGSGYKDELHFQHEYS